MRDEFNNNYGEDSGNDFQNESYNSTENNQESGSVNFELVNSTQAESGVTEDRKEEYDLWSAQKEVVREDRGNSQSSSGGRTQYNAPTYGYQSGQGSRNEYNNTGYGQQNNYKNQSSYSQQNNYSYQNNYKQSDYNQSGYGNSSSNYNQPNQTEFRKKDGKESFGKKLLKTAAIAAVFGLVAGVVFQGVNIASHKLFNIEDTTIVDDTEIEVTTTQNPAVSTSATTDVETLVENTMPAMVAITSTIVEDYRYFGHTFSQEAEGSGSGIIVGKNNNQLLIVTNNHVIDGAKTISVCFMDKEIVQADVKGTDPSSDLAVVAVDMKDIKDETKAIIKVATLGDSDNVKLGQMAVAIGNALGYGQSVTVGYISAKDRTITAGTGSNATTMSLIQTDAAINPGNSGGALLNMKGEVIGINSAKLADTNVEGMGYAIPITHAIPIINELMNREVLKENEKGYLGITGQNITEENNIYNMPIGVYVYEVAEEGAAKEAGMQQGDIIVKINGSEVKNMEAVQNKVNNTRVGTKITVSVMRNVNGSYEEIELEVTLKGYDSLNSIRAEEEAQNQREEDGNNPQNQYPDNGREYYYGNEDIGEFFEEFFGDFGY